MINNEETKKSILDTLKNIDEKDEGTANRLSEIIKNRDDAEHLKANLEKIGFRGNDHSPIMEVIKNQLSGGGGIEPFKPFKLEDCNLIKVVRYDGTTHNMKPGDKNILNVKKYKNLKQVSYDQHEVDNVGTLTHIPLQTSMCIWKWKDKVSFDTEPYETDYTAREQQTEKEKTIMFRGNDGTREPPKTFQEGWDEYIKSIQDMEYVIITPLIYNFRLKLNKNVITKEPHRVLFYVKDELKDVENDLKARLNPRSTSQNLSPLEFMNLYPFMYNKLVMNFLNKHKGTHMSDLIPQIPMVKLPYNSTARGKWLRKNVCGHVCGAPFQSHDDICVLQKINDKFEFRPVLVSELSEDELSEGSQKTMTLQLLMPETTYQDPNEKHKKHMTKWWADNFPSTSNQPYTNSEYRDTLMWRPTGQSGKTSFDIYVNQLSEKLDPDPKYRPKFEKMRANYFKREPVCDFKKAIKAIETRRRTRSGKTVEFQYVNAFKMKHATNLIKLQPLNPKQKTNRDWYNNVVNPTQTLEKTFFFAPCDEQQQKEIVEKLFDQLLPLLGGDMETENMEQRIDMETENMEQRIKEVCQDVYASLRYTCSFLKINILHNKMLKKQQLVEELTGDRLEKSLVEAAINALGTINVKNEKEKEKLKEKVRDHVKKEQRLRDKVQERAMREAEA